MSNDKAKMAVAKRERPRMQMVFTQPSKTKPSFRDECNINNIMAQYADTGMVAHMNKHGGSYSEMPSELDYQAGLNAVIQAGEMFADLPAAVRTRFHNDPANFLAFVDKPENHDEMVKMGLLKPKPVEPHAEPPKQPSRPKGPDVPGTPSAPPTPLEKEIERADKPT